MYSKFQLTSCYFVQRYPAFVSLPDIQVMQQKEAKKISMPAALFAAPEKLEDVFLEG
jgi:hypothetical protein